MKIYPKLYILWLVSSMGSCVIYSVKCFGGDNTRTNSGHDEPPPFYLNNHTEEDLSNQLKARITMSCVIVLCNIIDGNKLKIIEIYRGVPLLEKISKDGILNNKTPAVYDDGTQKIVCTYLYLDEKKPGKPYLCDVIPVRNGFIKISDYEKMRPEDLKKWPQAAISYPIPGVASTVSRERSRD